MNDFDITVEFDTDYMWRFNQLELVGIERNAAMRLARCGADWHVIAQAAENGATDAQLLDLFAND
jgi:hypothetical protein